MKKKEQKEKQRAVPNDHWEMKYNTCEPSENAELTANSDFVAKRGQDRKKNYVKINETDH
jgi:hypothetical protein